jgi:hypothetical protein
MTSNSRPNGAPSSELTQLGRQKSASYPGFTLRQAEELANAIFELGSRNCDQERVAQAVGYKTIKSSSFLRLRSTASQFELVQLEKNSSLSVTEEWIEVFHHSEDLQLLKKARRKAILRPKLYKQLIEEYTDRQFPSLAKLSRELYLNQRYGILKDAAEIAARIFLESASYAGLLNEKGYLANFDQSESQIEKEDAQRENSEHDVVITQREENKKPSYEDVVLPKGNVLDEPLPNLDGLERYQITLINRKKAYLYVPVPLPHGEKQRLKQYIDLILEEPANSYSKNSVDSLEDDV